MLEEVLELIKNADEETLDKILEYCESLKG